MGELYLTTNIIYSGTTLNACTPIICEGTNLNTVIASLYEALCNIQLNCKVQVSSTDECCGYLQAKLTSSDHSISIEKISSDNDDGDTCELLDLTVNVEDVVHMLYNTQGQVTRTTTGDFNVYNLAANTLKTDGDMIEIESFYEIASGSGVIYLTIDSVNLFTSHNALNYTFNPRYIRFKSKVTRIDATHISFFNEIAELDGVGDIVNINMYNTSSTVITSLTSNAVNISSTLHSVGGTSHSITNTFMTIKYYNA